MVNSDQTNCFVCGQSACNCGSSNNQKNENDGTVSSAVVANQAEISASMTAADSVTVGGSTIGTISSEGEVDFISVELQAGVTYQIDLEGSQSLSGTLGDPLLTGIFLEDGTRVANSNDDGGLVTNSRILFTPTVSGTFLIGASSFNNSNQIDTGTYTVYVDTQENSDRPDQHLTTQTPTTGNDFLDGLTTFQGFAASADGITRVSFSFPQSDAPFASTFNLDDEGPDLTQSNIPASARAIEIFRNGLEFISSVANIQFNEVIESSENFEVGVLRLSGNDAESGNVLGIAGLPGRSNTAGDIFLFEDFIGSSSRLDFVTLHELGHALGLSHPTDEFPTQFVGAEFTLLVPSFQSAFFDNVTSADLFPTSFGYGDILALRHIYDGLDDAFSGDTTYTFDLGSRYFETIYDLGGNDTIEITGQGRGVNIDLRPDTDAFGGRFIDIGTTVRYFASGSFAGSRTQTVFVSPETVIENIITSGEDDRVIGNEANNLVQVGAGDDTAHGGAGDDRVRGEDGNDRLQGGTGNDTVVGGTGNDTVSAGSGDDQVFAGSGDAGNDFLIGETGNDVLGGSAGNDLVVGGGYSGTLTGFDDVETSSVVAGTDTLFGGSGDDTLIVGGFNDQNSNQTVEDGEVVTSGSEANTAYAGTGDDIIYGDGGNDTLGGGIGNDTVNAAGGNDTIYGGQDTSTTGVNDVLNGGAGRDQIFAGAGNDSIDGGDGHDTIFGGSGNDTITGGEGDDDIFNSAGDDIVNAGAGVDTLRGNAGNDTLTGGEDVDTFVFNSGSDNDVITDFDELRDILRLSGTTTDFTNAVSVQAASSNETIDGVSGVLINLGGGDTVFLQGLTVNDVSTLNFEF